MRTRKRHITAALFCAACGAAAGQGPTGVWRDDYTLDEAPTDAGAFVYQETATQHHITWAGFKAAFSANFASSAELAALISDATGSGAFVLSDSPALVTPDIGTPSAGVATNLTGLPLATGVTGTLPPANGGTGLASLGTGLQVLRTNAAGTAAEWATPSSGGDFLADGTVPMTGDLDAGGNDVTNVGAVDGRDVSADGAKLDGVEALADVTDAANVAAAGALMADGSAALSGNLDAGGNDITNVGAVDGRDVSADGAKLDGVEALADVTDAANVAAAGALMADGSAALSGDLDAGGNDITNVGAVDGRDVSADGAKLDGVEALADVTDAANVAAAGAFMADGSAAMTGDLDAGGNDITNAGTVSAATLDVTTFTAASLAFDGTAFDTSLTATEPTAARSIALPDASGTVALTSDIPAAPARTETFVLTIDAVADSMDYAIGFVAAAFTVEEVRAVHAGAGLSSPDIDITVRHSTDRSAAGNAVDATPHTVTSSTAGDSFESGFEDATVPADSWIWIETSSISGTTANLEIIVRGTYD